MATKDYDFETVRTWFLGIIALILVGWMFRAATVVLVPVVLSFFITLIILPVTQRIEDWLPHRFRWVGILGAMAVLLVVFAMFVAGLWIGARRIASEMTQLPQRLNELLPASVSVPGTGESAGANEAAAAAGAGADAASAQATAGGEAAGGLSGVWTMLGENISSFASSFATTFLSSISAMLAGLILTFFFVLLMLATAPNWKGKAQTIWGRSGETGWRNAIDITAYKLRLYLLARAVLGVVTAVAYVAWLMIFGVDLLFVWALLAFLLNFIPNIGSIIAGVLPVLYALLSKDFGTVVIIGLGILAIEQVIGNFLDPKVQEREVALSPLVVLLAILFWGWIWGMAGALLGVPMMIAVMIVCAHIPVARPFALLLSNQRDMEGLDEVALEKRGRAGD